MKRLTIENMQHIARQRNGKCLSQTYVNSISNLRWKCSDGHMWNATSSNIKKGTWCPSCRDVELRAKCRKYSDEDIRRIANKKEGKCLSVAEYRNCKTYLEWECSKKHRWKDSLDHIINSDRWCSKCEKA